MNSYCCMAHERFNRVIKNPAKTMNNFRNPAFTYQYQYSDLINTISGFMGKQVEYGPNEEMDRINSDLFYMIDKESYAYMWVLMVQSTGKACVFSKVPETPHFTFETLYFDQLLFSYRVKKCRRKKGFATSRVT